MTQLEFENILNNDISIVEDRLIKLLPECANGQDEVVKAMKYSLSNGGKRLRPVLCLEFARACGADRFDALDFACAVEYIHTYSLIHDDLPCMDDDDMRRGKPSCHKEFGEATALLAGDALLTHAFQILAGAELDDKKIALACGLLAQNAGVQGMVGGQVIDLKYESETPDLQQLLSVHRLKTGALISAACLLGCIAAGADDEKIAAASAFAYDLGVAFQIKDDILDVVGSTEALGKPVGSDAENNKTTYVTVRGMENAQKDVEMLTSAAVSRLSAFENTDFLKTLALYLVNRNK
ncbi:MAG TPA: polyprenyl synthetase family protein [Candidatus Eubacterium faecale]|jgi:geranylgeranyl diphosphate synthase type II|uniref:Farnesyl diphosphate synthase n=1 Tax=Candidatus Eubacterium faecale TaxID=2838568 RepID=A0A9D2MI76_9FIRM|nr:polyprenyl synthetase family protein [Candidatus Eubacterium faecale]